MIKDSKKHIETQTLSADISDNQVDKISNLPDKLMVFIGARVMFTANINLSDHLINGSTGKIKYMQIPTASNNLVGIIYVKFDDIDTGNSLKNDLLRSRLKECVPITGIA